MVQEYYHPLPIIQLSLHRIRNVWINFLIIFVGYYCLVSFIYYLPVYFQTALGNLAIISGLKTSGFIVAFTIMSQFSDKIIMKTKHSNLVMGFCGCLIALGLGLCSLITPTLNYGLLFFFTFIMGVGSGFWIPASGALVQIVISQRDIAVAMSNYSFDGFLGSVIGITISGAIYNRSVTKYLNLGEPFPLATSKAVGDVFLWMVPAVLFASFFGFFLSNVNLSKNNNDSTVQLTGGVAEDGKETTESTTVTHLV